MNAIHMPSPHAPGPGGLHQDAPTGMSVRRRRWTIGLLVTSIFLGLYVLGLVWFAGELRADMQSSLQFAPAVQDTAHRSD